METRNHATQDDEAMTDETTDSIPLESDNAAPATSDIADFVEGYQIVRRICEGPTGAIYKAQERDTKRTVSLRVVYGEALRDPEHIKYFQREIEKIKHLRHPGIAAVLNIGTTETGNCFFVSEYARGASLREYAQMHKLSTTEWLTLFRRVCDGLHHAHQHGVVHRSLRPANIVVEGSLNPKIVGFGVAAITDSDIRLPAEPAAWLLAYRSPEQLCGKPLDVNVHSDVYAIGVMLYEALTGKLPYDLDVIQERADIVRAVCEADPAPPSQIKRGIHPDLDAIVTKALRKDPNARYPDVMALAQDIDDFLANKPVRAREMGGVYEFGKLVSRYKAVAGMSILTCAVAVALGVHAFIRLRQTDRHQFDLERMSAAASVTDLADAQKKIATEREHIELALKSEQDKRTTAEAEIKKLRNQLDQADGDRQHWIEKSHHTEASMHDMSDAARFLANMFRAAGQAGEETAAAAVVMLDQAGPRIDAEFRDQPETKAILYNVIGGAYQNLGRFGPAAEWLQKSYKTRKPLYGDSDDRTLDTMNDLAAALFAAGRLSDAEPICKNLYDRSVAVWGEDDPKTITALNNLAYTISGEGRLTEAATLFEKAVVARRRVLGPDNAKTAASVLSLASIRMQQGKPKDAEPLFADAVAVMSKQLDANDPSLADARCRWAETLVAIGQFDQAEAPLLAAYEIYQNNLGLDHALTRRTAQQIAAMYKAAGKTDQAATWRARAGESPAAS